MQYVTLQDCYEELFQIAMEFDASERAPDYRSNRKGLQELEGILKRVRESWYRGLIVKAAYLFVAICKGHLFINGNKRLSLIITLDFLYRNGFTRQKPVTRRSYRRWFAAEFPQYVLVNRRLPSTYGWAYYNLNKAIASDTVNSFNDLKWKVEKFLRFSVTKGF